MIKKARLLFQGMKEKIPERSEAGMTCEQGILDLTMILNDRPKECRLGQ